MKCPIMINKHVTHQGAEWYEYENCIKHECAAYFEEKTRTGGIVFKCMMMTKAEWKEVKE